PVVLNEDGWQALAHGQDLGLTAVEFQLLRVMMQAPGRIFSREQLMDHMYRDNRIVSERTVDSHIKKLRKKIHEALPELEIIRSVYGVGYKYQPEG
ncbi:MAG: winged helix-turn-helix domain-containing protein, partial [Halomonas sp.]